MVLCLGKIVFMTRVIVFINGKNILIQILFGKFVFYFKSINKLYYELIQHE